MEQQAFVKILNTNDDKGNLKKTWLGTPLKLSTSKISDTRVSCLQVFNTNTLTTT